MFQSRSLDNIQATPLVVDGVMYTMQGNDVVALDAATGKSFWIYPVHAGVRRAGSAAAASPAAWRFSATRCFTRTLDAHLIAIDAKNGRPLWNTDRRAGDRRATR